MSSIKGALVVCAVLSMGTSFACMCFFSGIFEDYADQHPIVIRGTVTQHGEELPNISTGYFRTMKIDVSGTIKGSFPHTTFEFYGDTGMSCLRYISLRDFPVGSEHLFILRSDESLQPLMSCGESSLLILGDTVQGYVQEASGYNTYELGLEELIGRLQ
ncbi:MAG: hypothetical protein ACSHXZ_13335 [Gammaproteobacteria bacterium]